MADVVSTFTARWRLRAKISEWLGGMERRRKRSILRANALSFVLSFPSLLTHTITTLRRTLNTFYSTKGALAVTIAIDS